MHITEIKMNTQASTLL